MPSHVAATKMDNEQLTLEFAIGMPVWPPPALGLLERDPDCSNAWLLLRRAWRKGGELMYELQRRFLTRFGELTAL